MAGMVESSPDGHSASSAAEESHIGSKAAHSDL